MKFKDEIINRIKLTITNELSQLIIEHLCGEMYEAEKSKLSGDDIKLLKQFLIQIKTNGINYEQFNEILLLLNQDIVSKGFFEFFFAKERILLDDLKKGITKFKGFAMLRFGNFRYAYKQLIKKDKKEIEDDLLPYSEKFADKLKKFKKRPHRILKFKNIKRSETWYGGYISQKKFNKENEYLKNLVSSGDTKKLTKKEKNYLALKFIYIKKKIEQVEQKLQRNNNIYLTSDYMDVYVATSMRHKWEFFEVFDLIKKVFGFKCLKRLNLRYFDPTQSKCAGRVDKGLCEGLMLKRCLCAIYMAQESDTMGKDSELAATLAQGKPVIVYIPNITMRHAK